MSNIFKNKMKKRGAVLLAVALIVSQLAACSKSKSGQEGTNNPKQTAVTNFNPSGMPIVKVPITLKMFTVRSQAHDDWNKLMVWSEYERISGIHVQWEQVTQQQVKEKRNILLASGDLPDAFFKQDFTSAELLNYGSQGTFIKLNDMIDKYGGNIKAGFTNYPTSKKSIKMTDGNIYSLPFINDDLAGNITNKLWINKKWMDDLGLKAPTTTDELYKVLKEIKEKDPNHNGKADEIAISTPGGNGTVAGFEGVLQILLGSWGLQNRGNQHRNVDVDESTKKLRFIPTTPQYREVLEYAAKLYADKLLDQDIFTITNPQFAAKHDQGVIGAFPYINHAFSQKHMDEYVGLDALKGPHGDQLCSSVNDVVKAIGTFTITKNNKYPEETLRWVDYFYSDEGSRLFYMGVKDKTYTVSASGDYDYLPEIRKNPNGLMFNQSIGQYLCWSGDNNPAIKFMKYSKGGTYYPVNEDVTKRLKPYLPKEIWPVFSFTLEENDRLLTLANDMNSYRDEMIAKFVTGRTPFSEWDNYVASFKKMGLEEYMKIYQSAYERYQKQ